MLDLKTGDDLLDMCAGPGGKSLAAMQTLKPGVRIKIKDERGFSIGVVWKSITQSITLPRLSELFKEIFHDPL